MAEQHGVGDSPSRRFHEDGSGDAAGDGGGIRPGHLRTAQKDEFVVGSDFAHCPLNGARAIGAADRN